MAKVVCIYSGGMDSRTVLQRAIHEGNEVSAISFNYGQKHNRELISAAVVTRKLGIPHKVVDISGLNQLVSNSALTDPDFKVPEGHYADENMKQTVVPNRNMMLISMAAAYAINEGAEEVWYGAHGGDHDIYPDCRAEFVEAMQAVLLLCDWTQIKLVVPYQFGNKEVILRDGYEMGVDYADTWTCYNGREKACGKCGACQERLEAFAAIGKTDPVPYEDESEAVA